MTTARAVMRGFDPVALASGQRDGLVVAHDGQEHKCKDEPRDSDGAETGLPAPALGDEPAQHHAEHRPEHSRGNERAEHRAAHAERKQGCQKGGADRSVRSFTQADDAARTDQLRIASGECGRDRREAPDERHEENALDPAPPVGQQRQRHRPQRDGDRDDGNKGAQLTVRQVPLRLEVREHGHDNLAVDIVHDHQREDDREHRPGVTSRRRTMVRRVVGQHGASRYSRRSFSALARGWFAIGQALFQVWPIVLHSALGELIVGDIDLSFRDTRKVAPCPD